MEVLRSLVMYAAIPWVTAGQHFWFFGVYSFLSGFAFFVAGIYFAIYPGGSAPWRWFFIVSALKPAASNVIRMLVFELTGVGDPRATMIVSIASTMAPSLLQLLLLLGGIASDHRSGRTRHWTHWVGVAGFAFSLLMAGWMAFSLLVEQPLLEPA